MGGFHTRLCGRFSYESFWEVFILAFVRGFHTRLCERLSYETL